MLFGKAKEFQQCHGPSTAGFSFEAGGRTFPSVVFHSMSGTLMKISVAFLKLMLHIQCYRGEIKFSFSCY